MSTATSFEPIVAALRAEIVDHFAERGEDIDTDAGRRTLDTNSSLAALRADMLIAPFLARSGHGTLEGLRIADVGCGFGSIALALAARGATVVGVDVNTDRMQVGARVAAAFGLDAMFRPGSLQEPGLDPRAFDVVVVNNALCYLVPQGERRTALAGLRVALAAGGWIVVRDPNQAHPRDVFTGIPLVQRLPPRAGQWLLELFDVHRSRVRLTTPRAARRQLRRAGFANVRFDGAGDRRRWLDRAARYHHTSGQNPGFGLTERSGSVSS